jgi:hypothetical protein
MFIEEKNRIMMNRNRLRDICCGVLGLLMVSSSLLAHHAGAALYDTEHPITLIGVVTEYDFVNPHTHIHFDVKNAEGVIEKWVAESAPPQRLFRAGWTRDSLKPGDQITVTGFAMKDSTKNISIKSLTGPDGKVLSQGAY